MASARQRDRVEGYIAKGRAEGARITIGGGRTADRDHGWFVEPTVFADVDNNHTIAQEEIFGPVLCVIPQLVRRRDSRPSVKLEPGPHWGRKIGDLQCNEP